MDVYLDGERLDGAGTTLSTTLDAARAKVASGRLIVEAYADGEAIPEGELSQPPATDPYATEIKLISADAARLVQGPLVQASEAIGALEGRHAEIASRLQSGEIAGALNELNDVLSDWTTGRAVLDLAGQLLGPDAAGDRADVSAAVERLSGALTELKRSLAEQDWSGLADALEFDLEPLCSEWSGMLQHAAAHAGG